MRHLFSSILLLVCVHALFAQEGPSLLPDHFAFAHVSVIDVIGERVKTDMTVVVAGRRIVAIGKTRRVHLPETTRFIDATGRFLIPGLWDMHVHLGTDELDKNASLSLFLVNGVTGIRIMAGAPEYKLWRKEIGSGALSGPRMMIASRIIDGPKSYLSDIVIVHNEHEAHQAVITAAKEGADFVKVHDNIPRNEYFAVIEEARRQHLPVEGHVPSAISAAEASAAGQKSIEHFTGLSEAESDPRKADEIVSLLRKNHTWVCPTIIMRHNYAVLDNPKLANDSRLRYVKPSWKRNWLKMTSNASSLPATDWAGRKQTVRREKALVGRMQRGGVGLLAGTDVSNPYVFPGFSVHDELVMLVESGLTPMQALKTATINPAKFFNRVASLGSVERGKLADLVLLDANPLADIHNTSRISAVVVNGRLLRKDSLNEVLSRVESAMKAN